MGISDRPLLLDNHKVDAVGGDAEAGAAADYPAVRTSGEAWAVFAAESRKLWAIGAPIALNLFCLYGYNSLTQVFVGHLGNLELSAVAITLNVLTNFAFGFLLGMGSALETLCGQAFGARQVAMLGIYLQRSWILLLVTALIISLLFFFATPVLVLIGQDSTIAALAGKFAIAVIPQVFASAITFPSQKFLQAQSKVAVLAAIGLIGLVLHVAMLALFIYVFGWGLAGAAAAFDISAWAVALAQVAYIVGWCHEGWTGLSRAAFRDIWAFLRLSLASAFMLCLEIWYIAILTVLTGHLDNAEIAVGSISICLNINGWEGMIFIGINAAVSVRVSNELGAGRPRTTKYAVIVILVQSLAIGLFCMAVVFATRNYFSLIFTSDKDMQRAVAKIAYLLAVTMVLNSIQPVVSGVAVGGGWQALVAYINLGCYYIFGLPLGFLLGYLLKLGVQVMRNFFLSRKIIVLTLVFFFFLGNLDGHALWSSSTDTNSSVHSLEDRLEERGKPSRRKN
ncbi:protein DETOXIFICATION 34-like isoform X1 [Zingiber officinale]|uniref:protein DETOXIFICATION 34-like isoform X1 n=1 Tax=Zingiber officinale TaxID=94328 RepID=UPI001C4B9678|nr:protein DETOXIFICATION 34-like isoform X1 [Zingiber officinale]